jgi:acyl dehydratase
MKSFKNIKVGTIYSFKRFVSKKDVQDFTRLTGDLNPLHTNSKFAKTYKFEKNIVHGMLSASFFSALVGMYLPVRNCLYLSQNLKFHSVLYPNQKIKVLGKVVGKSDVMRVLTLKTEVRNAQDQVIIDGEAKIKVLT